MKFRWRQWFNRYSVYSVIGLGGTHSKERPRAKFVWRVFSYFMLFIAIWLLMQWHFEAMHQISHDMSIFANLTVLSILSLGIIIMLMVCKYKILFLQRNWLLYIIILSLFIVTFSNSSLVKAWDYGRPFLALYIMIPAFRSLKNFFIDGKLNTTLLASAIIIVIFGTLASGVDPNIKSPAEGIWWALATVSTVGYGDVVPTSPLGKVIGGLLILVGIGIFVTITANILAIILKKEKKYAQTDPHSMQINNDINNIKKTQQNITEQLQALQKSIDENMNKK